MNQLDLFKIPRQPAPKNPELSSAVIRAYVKQSLQGFEQRQKEREQRRQNGAGRPRNAELFQEPTTEMKTAQEFARAAVEIGQAAEKMKPEDTDPYAQQRKLIQYHLLSAARLTRELAAAKVKQETPTA